jgi:nitrate/nitrite-specific signal transduction histidine kinase
MLRRKLVIFLGIIVVLFLATAVLAMIMLQSVLTDMNHVCHEAMGGVHSASSLGATITQIEAELDLLEADEDGHLDDLIVAVQALESDVEALSAFYITRDEAAEPFAKLRAALPIFVQHVGNMATTQDPALTRFHTEQALQTSAEMRHAVATLIQVCQANAQTKQTAVTAKFRSTVLGLAVAFLVLINVSIIVLLRAASMVLRPVDQLVDASRRLAREEFAHRVAIDQKDEFAELAHAYNHLAEQLGQNEQRKLETLQQLARTLNHELNNALAIIEMKLSLLARQASDPEETKKSLEEIRAALQRMGATVSALTRIRRIVLTDYLDGVQMVDLARSTEEQEDAAMAAHSLPHEASNS